MRIAWPPSSGLRPSMDCSTSPSSSLNASFSGACTTSTPSVAPKYAPSLGVMLASSMPPNSPGKNARKCCTIGMLPGMLPNAPAIGALGHAHVEHALVERHGPRDDREVLVLAVAQHAHLHLLFGFDGAHLVDQRAIGIAAGGGHAVERDDEVAVAQAGLGGRAARAHAEHAHAFLAAVRIDLDSEHAPCADRRSMKRMSWRAFAPSCVDSSATSRAALSSRARASFELGAGLRLFGFALGRSAARSTSRLDSCAALVDVASARPRSRSAPTNKPASAFS